MESNSIFSENIKTKDSVTNNYIRLFDRGDRLGSHLSSYIATILLAIKKRCKIILLKPKTEYFYYNSIFVELLFNFIEYYNEQYLNTNEEKNFIVESGDFFKQMINCVIEIKSDFITAFKDNIFIQKFKENLNELAKNRNYTIPYNTEKTIVVHLRLDDKSTVFVNNDSRYSCSTNVRNIIDNDDINYSSFDWAGQSAIEEEEITKIINRALEMYTDYEVIIVTNGNHTLPYKTINSTDESYDLFLLCNSPVIIGSMSTFSFCSLLFGNHKAIYYPLWDHIVLFGLTTKYDKNNIIEFF